MDVILHEMEVEFLAIPGIGADFVDGMMSTAKALTVENMPQEVRRKLMLAFRSLRKICELDQHALAADYGVYNEPRTNKFDETTHITCRNLLVVYCSAMRQLASALGNANLSSETMSHIVTLFQTSLDPTAEYNAIIS